MTANAASRVESALSAEDARQEDKPAIVLDQRDRHNDRSPSPELDEAAKPLVSKKALWAWLILCFSVRQTLDVTSNNQHLQMKKAVLTPAPDWSDKRHGEQLRDRQHPVGGQRSGTYPGHEQTVRQARGHQMCRQAGRSRRRLSKLSVSCAIEEYT